MGHMWSHRLLLVLPHESHRELLAMEYTESKEIKAKKQALVVFQVAIYGFLAAMIIVQLVMWSQRHW